MTVVDPLRLCGQALLLALFLAFVGYFSDAPVYQHLEEDEAVVKISVRHSGALVGECHQRSAEELAQLQPTMRNQISCPRERSPLQLQLSLNGESLVDVELQARGLHRDGIATFYRRMVVPSGEVAVDVRLNDDQRQEGFPYRLQRKIVLQPQRVAVITFDGDRGEFDIQ